MIKKILLASTLALVFSSCDQTELDLLESPNRISASSGAADASMVMNGMSLDLRNSHYTLSRLGGRLTRQLNMRGSYASNATNTSLNSVWANAYEIDKNLIVISEIVKKTGAKHHVLGSAQVIKAFSMVNLVDFIGSTVYDESNTDELNPKLESGKDVYEKVFTLLDEAISNLKKEDLTILQDPYTAHLDGAERANYWIKVANSLKLKMYLQTRLVNESESVSGINSILASGDYIKTDADDFELKYSATTNPVDSRHPWFTSNYLEGGSTYMSNALIKRMLDSNDPRVNYYFYRQTNEDPSGEDLPCEEWVNKPSDIICYTRDGYWGRDHGADDGIPADNTKRATYGIYPAGGAYDDDAFKAVTKSKNDGGKGVLPILLSSYIDFMLAESALTIGTTGDAKVYLASAVEKSFDKVASFYSGEGSITATSKVAYVDSIKAEFDAATSDDDKLDIIIREYHTASFGNGVESYNTYRRTSFPSDLQGPQKPLGDFPRSFFYPNDEVISNTNVNQKVLTDKVFWDTNDTDFLKDTEDVKLN